MAKKARLLLLKTVESKPLLQLQCQPKEGGCVETCIRLLHRQLTMFHTILVDLNNFSDDAAPTTTTTIITTSPLKAFLQS